jgi:hypothetical protein
MAMTDTDYGVLYYNTNTKCLVRLMTSIYALRKVYDGQVALIHDGKPRVDLVAFCAEYDVQIVEQPKATEYALVRKSQLWRVTPFQYSVFLDADTLPLADPTPLAELAKSHGFVVHHFADWKTTGGKVSGRIRAWEPAIGKSEVKKALKYGKAVNTGIFAFDRDAQILRDWEQITRLGYDRNCTRRLVDEVACQVILHNHIHTIVGPDWGCSGRFGDVSTAKVIHYHGSKHVFEDARCDPWKAMYSELEAKHGKQWPLVCKPNGDKRFARWRNERHQRKDITIVTACNPKYVSRFEKNFKLWMKDDALKHQQFIVFINCMRKRDKRLAFLAGHDNVRVIKWRWPIAGDNVRERMLSAFVFGAAEYVETDYWMKLDGDATPVAPWIWPDYSNHTIVGHKCGYTKTKGENVAGHFLNHLDAHKGGEPAFPVIEGKTHRHQRLASYCWIERADFTRQLAEWCGDRLPVPSHDTTACYYARYVLGLTVGNELRRMNMREYFRP